MNPTSAKVPLLRLDQALSRFGFCGRREAAYWVKNGRVAVKGEVVCNPDARADPADLLVDGQPVDFPRGMLIAFHKPVGLVCSHEAREGERIYDRLPQRLMNRNPVPATIGRLDKDTSGLVFITDSGDLIHRWTSPRHEVEKEYEATLDADLPADAVALLAAGTLMLADEHKKDHLKPCKPAQLHILTPRRARLTLTEGRYHQVRRMFAALGAAVLTLHRLRVGGHTLDGLPEGEWREVALPAG